MARVTMAARFQQVITPNAFRSYLAEFISTFFFVFAVVGSMMSSRKLMPNASSDPTSLLMVAITNAFALASAVYISSSSSGGHVNPAVTFAKVVGGHISVPITVIYWICQMVAAVMACLLLKVTTVAHYVPTYAITQEMTGFGASILEGVLTFGLVYTIYAAGDTRNGALGALGPLAIGFMAGANVMATGPFSGGSMNPACAFGAAVISGTFKNQAVYWIGPLIGAAAAGLVYDNVMFPVQESQDNNDADALQCYQCRWSLVKIIA